MNNTTNETQSVEPTPSPVIAGMVAMLMMPREYARIMADAELSCRQKCKLSVYRIDK